MASGKYVLARPIRLARSLLGVQPFLQDDGDAVFECPMKRNGDGGNIRKTFAGFYKAIVNRVASRRVEIGFEFRRIESGFTDKVIEGG